MMDAALKGKWIAALRSGEYKQCTGTLRTLDSKEHCCLGVLCEVGGLPLYEDGQNVSPYILINEKLGGEFTSTELWTMNDSRQYDFGKIADYIEGKRNADNA